MKRTLSRLLEDSAGRCPLHTAVEDADRNKAISYSVLSSQTDLLCGTLIENGVRSGDRVGICAPKSIGSVVSILGTLKTGAACVS